MVGNVVVSDCDDDEVLDDYNVTNYFGSGGNTKSLLEQLKEDTCDYNTFKDDYLDDCGLSVAQLRVAGIRDIRL